MRPTPTPPETTPMDYDLSQLRWGEAGTSDEREAQSLARGTSLRPVPVAALHGRFAALAAAALRTGEATRPGRFALAATVVEGDASLPADLRLATLRRLQRRAAELTAAPDVPEGDDAHLALRPWRRDEARTLRALLDDREVWRHLPDAYPGPLSDEVALALIERAADGAEHVVRAIAHDERVVGQVRLHLRSPHGAQDAAWRVETVRDAELSYWLGRDHWGQGIASEVIPRFTRVMFAAHDLHSIFARVDEGNGATRRALEKAGFADEGDAAATLDGDGRVRTLRAFRADYLRDAAADASSAALRARQVPRR